VEVYGINSIYSVTPTVLFGASNAATTPIDFYGTLKTNIPALGTGVTSTNKTTITYP
jgi:hypothetical protein